MIIDYAVALRVVGCMQEEDCRGSRFGSTAGCNYRVE